VLAQEAASQLELKRVLLVPTGRAPHKEIVDEPGELVRLEMTELVAAGNGVFDVERFEIDRALIDGHPSYTVSTLEELRRRHPRHEWFLLMGADVAAGLGSWHEPERILELAKLAIAARPGTVLDDAEAVLDRLGSAGTEVIRMPEVGVSSTRIRRRVAQARPIRYLVPDSVLELIEAQGLYRK
jgi:nicotinate-nucleotide adenylyltransferase